MCLHLRKIKVSVYILSVGTRLLSALTSRSEHILYIAHIYNTVVRLMESCTVAA